MYCPSCGKKPVGFKGSLYLKGVGFKKAFQGFFRCRHCNTLLIQEKNESGMPKFEKPFGIAFSLLFMAILVSIWGAFTYIESTIGPEPAWYTIPTMVGIFILFFVAMEQIRVRYWILKETTFEEHEKEIQSQKLSQKGLIAFILFAVAAILGFLYMDSFVENLELSATAYTFSVIAYMIVILAMAFGLMKYLSNKFTLEQE
jgi:hypothetical protein